MKINTNNKIKIQEAINKKMGKARSFKATASELIELSRTAEKRLSIFGLPKNSRSGAVMVHRDPLPRSYKYKTTASKVTLARGAKDWFLVSVERVDLYPGSDRLFKVLLKEEHIEASKATWKKDDKIEIV